VQRGKAGRRTLLESGKRKGETRRTVRGGAQKGEKKGAIRRVAEVVLGEEIKVGKVKLYG